MKSETKKNILYFIIISFAAVYYIEFILRTSVIINGIKYFSLFDDAMISMRYAKNLASGYGLVWNPGEYVEGYTNFLWVIWMTVLHLFPVHESKITLLVAITGVIILILNLLVVKSLAEKLSDKSVIVTSLSLIFTAFFYGLVYWTLRGMEVGLLTLLINVSVLLIFKLQDNFSNNNFVNLILVMGAVTLLRADTLIFIIFFLLYFYFTVPVKNRIKVFLILLSAMLGFILAQTIFRLVYYDDFLPNTYYLKLTGFPMLVRITRGLLVFEMSFLYNLTALIVPVVLFLIFYYRQLDKKRIFCLAGIFVLTALYSIYVGGDSWEGLPYTNRYITVSIPLLIILLAISLKGLFYKFKSENIFFISSAIFVIYIISVYVVYENLKPAFITIPGQKIVYIALCSLYIFTLGIIVLLFYKKKSGSRVYSFSLNSAFLFVCILIFFIVNEYAYSAWIRKNASYVEYDKSNIALGLKIKENTTEDLKIAVSWAGAIPYYSNRYSIDLLGKMDKNIAKGSPHSKFFLPGHSKWDHIYSINNFSPDLIIEIVEIPKDSLKSILDNEYDAISGYTFVKKGTTKILKPVF